MIDIFTYKIFYFTVALLVGFLIGYFLKKDSYEEKIKDSVKDYEKKYEETIQKLKLSKENLAESQTRLDINKDLLETQLSIINKLDKNILAIKQKNISVQESKQDLYTKLDNIKNQIQRYEEEINNIKPKYSKIENNINKHNNLIIELETLSQEKDTLENNMQELSQKSNLLSEKIQKLNKNDAELDIKISELEEQLQDIKKKENLIYAENTDKLDSLIEDTRVKFLNYKYKYEDLTNKLSNSIKIDMEDIKKFILKMKNRD